MQVLASWEGCGTHHWRYHSPTVRRWCTTNPNNRTSTLSVFFPQKISGEETKFQLRMCNYHQVESSYYGRCNTTHLHLLLKEKIKIKETKSSSQIFLISIRTQASPFMAVWLEIMPQKVTSKFLQKAALLSFHKASLCFQVLVPVSRCLLTNKKQSSWQKTSELWPTWSDLKCWNQCNRGKCDALRQKPVNGVGMMKRYGWYNRATLWPCSLMEVRGRERWKQTSECSEAKGGRG